VSRHGLPLSKVYPSSAVMNSPSTPSGSSEFFKKGSLSILLAPSVPKTEAHAELPPQPSTSE
jgi:hypothetical protein